MKCRAAQQEGQEEGSENAALPQLRLMKLLLRWVVVHGLDDEKNR